MIDTLSTFEVSQNSSTERPRERSTNSDSASLFSELLNLSCQPKQDYPQPKSSEHNLEAETSTATDAANIETDSPKASCTPVQRSQSEHAQQPAVPQANSDNSNNPEVKKPDETDEKPLDSTRQQIPAEKAETGSDDAVASNETANDELASPKSFSQLIADKGINIQQDPQIEEKLPIEFSNFKKNEAEPAGLTDLIRSEDGKNLLRLATPALANTEDVEVLSENGALESQQVSRFAKNSRNSEQPTLLNLSLESEKNSESSNVIRGEPNRSDAPILKNVNGAEEFGAPRSASEPLLNIENLRQFVTERGSGNQKDVNPQLSNTNKNLDILTPALLKSETFTAQTAADKSSQNILSTIELVEGIKEKLLLMVRGADERAVFKLNPPELGRLEIRLELLDKSCRAEIQVQDPIVKSLIESHSNELARGLQNAGLELTDLSVSMEMEGDKRESVLDGTTLVPNEKASEENAIKKQAAPAQRINRISDGVVDIIA